MKNIFEHHVREVHLTEDRKLRLRVANIDQAIEALETIKQGLDQLGPKCPEFEMDLKKQLIGSESRNCEKAVSRIEISFVEKQKTHHRDVYIIHVYPNLRNGTTVIINEDDVDAVKARLVKLVKRFEQERKKSPVRELLSPSNVIQMVGRVQRVTPVVEVHTLTVEDIGNLKPKREIPIEHILALDKMGTEQLDRQSEPGCEPKQRDIFNLGKENK